MQTIDFYDIWSSDLPAAPIIEKTLTETTTVKNSGFFSSTILLIGVLLLIYWSTHKKHDKFESDNNLEKHDKA